MAFSGGGGQTSTRHLPRIADGLQLEQWLDFLWQG